MINMANKYDSTVAQLRGQFFKEGLIVPPLHEEHLNRIEAQLGHHLPDDYREFLRDYAGVGFPSATFPMMEDGESRWASIFMFYGSSLADIYHQGRRNFDLEDGYKWYPGLRLVRNISVPVAVMEWPEELLRIGSDQGGNEICLALFGFRPGAVFWWRNAPFSDADNLYLVANSFDEFMHLIESGD